MSPSRGKRRPERAADPEESQPAAEGGGEPGGLLNLHRSRFVRWEPSAAVALAVAPDGSLVAVAREDGDVELFETEYWTVVQRIPGHQDASRTCLAWAQPAAHAWRLISAGLDGQITELEPRTCRTVATTDSYGGPVWGMAVEPITPVQLEGGVCRLAVACDDGCLRLFRIQTGKDGAEYYKAFPKVAGRLLSVAWGQDGDTLVTGSSDSCIRIWQASTGRELRRITAAVVANSDLCIWSVAVLSGGEIASGDSSGRVAIWDGRFGTLQQSFTRHAADVMSVVPSPDGSMLFASGVDSQVAAFKRVPGKAPDTHKWVYLDYKRPHSHDVRALAIISQGGDHDPLLLSGGNDAQLYCYSIPRFQKEHAVRVCKCPQQPIVETSSTGPISGRPVILSCHKTEVDLWEVGVPQKKDGGKEGELLEVEEPPRHLARISGIGRGHLTSAAVSPDGALIAMSDSRRICLCEMTRKGNSVTLTRRRLPTGVLPAAHLAFSGSGSHLIVCGFSGRVQVVNVSANDAEVVAEFSQLEGPPVKDGSAIAHCSAPAVSLAVDMEGKWAAVVCTKTVHLLSLSGPKPVYHGRVPAPKHVSPISAAAFTPKGDKMVVATAGNHIAMFQVETCLATPYWHKDPSNEVERRLESMPGSISGLSFLREAHCHRLIAYTSGGFCLIDFDKSLHESDSGKSPKKLKRGPKKPEPQNDKQGSNFRVIHLVEPCLYMGYVGASDALLVEHPWAEVAKAFPAPLYKHRYGT